MAGFFMRGRMGGMSAILIPAAIFLLLSGMVNAILAGPVASLNNSIFSGLGFPRPFVELFGSETGMRMVGWGSIGLSPVLLVIGLLSGK
jgi:hypothetical protein